MDDLIDAARSGSNPAWQRIIAELGPAVHGFARSRGAEPDELTQEVFLDAARGIAEFDGGWPAFRSWVFTIAYRRVADHHRRQSRRLRTVPVDDAERLSHTGPQPDEYVMRNDATAELLQALDSLSQIERDVVVLRVIGELSSDEVAAVVGKSPGNVRVIQTRALAHLRANLEKKSVTNSLIQRLPA